MCAPADVRARGGRADVDERADAEEPTTAALTPSKPRPRRRPPSTGSRAGAAVHPRTATIRAGGSDDALEQLKLARRPAEVRLPLAVCIDPGVARVRRLHDRNLETTVGSTATSPTPATCCSTPGLCSGGQGLRHRLSDPANNHMLDRYFDGMVQTVNLVNTASTSAARTARRRRRTRRRSLMSTDRRYVLLYAAHERHGRAPDAARPATASTT